MGSILGWSGVRGLALIGRLRRDRRGIATMEYGLIAAFVAVALVAVLSTLGTSVSGLFASVAMALDSAGVAAVRGG